MEMSLPMPASDKVSFFALVPLGRKEMSSSKVFIYTEYDGLRGRRAPGPNLLGVLPFITTDDEYSFSGAAMLSHGSCLEAEVGRRPPKTFIEVRRLLASPSQIPYVYILDFSTLCRSVVQEIERSRRWMPLAVFILHCTDGEYDRCIAEAPNEWKIRLSRFFRLPKNKAGLSRKELRRLLDVATATAIEKVKCAHIFSTFISYSHSDHDFAQWLHDALAQRGIKCWLDKKQLRAGDRIHTKVASAIQERDKILLCASSASLTSWWVDNELNSVITKEQALWKQTKEETLALIPLNLDGFMFTDAWKSGWKSQVVSRLAPDFTKWTKEQPWDCADALASLIRALIIDTTTKGNPFSEA